MKSYAGNAPGRWLVVFTFLLIVSSAVPVLAAEPSPSSGEPPPVAADEQPPSLPDAQAVQEGVEAAERAEAEREQWLQSPEAALEREQSRYAFADLTAAEAEQLLLARFSEQLATLNGDPARFLSDAQLLRPLDAEGTVAAVKDEGNSTLLDAGMPVRTEDEEGDLAKVDLSLEATPQGFEPANPLTELSIPDEAAQPIVIGAEGLAVRSAAASPGSQARLLGDENVFYPDAHSPEADTDRLVSPIGAGVEIFELLRSADSPEAFGYELELPEGAELRPDGSGGAIAVSQDEVLASIPAPHATDAQGTHVPVELQVEGRSMTLRIAHREADLAYPILLDPAVMEDTYNYNWFNGYNHSELTNGSWKYSESNSWVESSTSCIFACWGVGRGLFVSMPGGAYWAQQYGHWYYSAPPNSYLANAWANPLARSDHNCSISAYAEPHDYVGMWHNGQWNRFLNNMAAYWGHADIQMWGSSFIVGMSTGNGASNPCWRDIGLGGAAIWLDDWLPPLVSSVSGVPGGWIGKSTAFTVSALVHDGGLGIYRVVLGREGGGQPIVHNLGCTGVYGNRCPTTHTEPFHVTGAAFDEGIQPITITATDPTAKTSTSWQGSTRVDGTAPEVTLSGQLAAATDEAGPTEQPPGQGDELSLPVYNLTIAAKDGNSGTGALDKEKRSGVKDIEIWLDGEELEVPWAPQSCPASSCPMTKTYPLHLTGLTTAGEHKLEVKVFDQVGNLNERTIEFEYFPATGMKDEYVMHYFPLPDGQGDEAEEEHPDRPELAVNVMNGNLVYREEDVEVDGPAVDLEVERYYNSQLPTAENTEWGDGWTLAQTPDLELSDPPPGSSVPEEGDLLEASGAIEGDVELPVQTGATSFDPDLQATVTKTASGYELTDETGESATSTYFNEAGRTEALLTDGDAKVDYVYSEGELAEIAVSDPGSAGNPTEAPQEEGGEPSTGPYTGVVYANAFGTEGSGPGQLKHPASVAIDAAGNLWVIDRGNDRVQKFSPEGEYLDHFGSSGTGDGQFVWPSDLDIDSGGNIWVTDSANHRVQKFSPQGDFLLRFGSYGTGNAQFSGPAGIAAYPNGWIGVTDRGNHRVQAFTKAGTYVGQIGTPGWGDTQFDEPLALAIGGPWGEFGFTVFVVDGGNNRIKRYTPYGAFISKFGTYGTGDGQLDSPASVEVDAKGNVWVGDRRNARVQLFDQDGTYVDQFGAKGSEEGQFDLAYPMGIASDGAGGLWVTDGNHNRLQKWVAGSYEPDPTEQLPEDDPAVAVATPGGLVSSLVGEEAGSHAYEHSGDDLTSHSGPAGESSYEYDPAGRMTKVTLPNGTWGQVAYHADGRVKAVTVDPAGSEAAKTTEFQFSDEPRRTTVTPPDKAQITYDIGGDGSVFKWRHAETSPDLEPLGGSLYDEKERLIATGAQSLVAQAISPHGIASIEVIVNGDQLVDEAHCEQDPDKEGLECLDLLKNEWVLETSGSAPGIMQLEVIATDRLGRSESERFWVDVPYTPPEPPGALTPPKYSEIKRFREEYGLEVVFPVANELELNDRIFELMAAWHNPHTPAGEVARTSWERWGVPLRTEDVAELEYREWLYEVNAEKIDQWVEATSPGSYAGYYMNHPAGGIMHIGFLGNQSEQLASLEASLSLVGGSSRLSVYPNPPTVPYVAVRATTESVMDAIEANSTLADLVISVEDDEAGRATRVGTSNVAQVEGILDEMLGANAPVTVEYEAGGGALLAGRYRNEGRMRAGDYINSDAYSFEGAGTGGPCTAGFGAEDIVDKPGTKKDVHRLFVLTAGHCAVKLEQEVWRNRYDGDHTFPFAEAGKSEVGRVRRPALQWREPGGVRTDATAIRISQGGIVPRAKWGWDGHALPTKPASRARKGNVVCYSGALSKNVSCGKIVARSLNWLVEGTSIYLAGYWVRFPEGKRPEDGDSGSPVWNKRTGASIGLVSAGRPLGSFEETLVAPLLHPPNMPANRVPGILHHHAMEPLRLKLGG